MEIQCNFSTYSKYYYKCTVTSINITEPSKVASWKGKHLENKSNENVTWLSISNQNVKFVPENLLTTFLNTTQLTLQNCGLISVKRSDLAGLEKLTTLDLSRNKLVMLPDDLFRDMKNIENIHFNNNQIRFLSSMLLKPLEKKLLIADFKTNVKIDECFNKKTAGQDDLQKFMATIDGSCSPPGTRKLQKVDSLNNMLTNFEKLRTSEKLLDFTIEVQGKTFKVHKCVLSAQSSVFDEMFSKDTAKATQALANVKTINQKDFEAFLNYFYTGRVDAGVSPVTMIQLASEFDVPDLKIMCAEKILDDLSELNALEVFNIGHNHKVDELIQLGFKFIKKVFPYIDDDLIKDRDKLNKTVGIGQNLDRWN